MTTYEPNVSMTDKVHQKNNVVYEDDEVENSSETSNYASSNSSFVEDTKKRDSLTSVEDNKEEKSKRSKRNSSPENGNFLRPNSRTSTNNEKSKNRRSFIFFSDNEDDNNKPDVDIKKGRKSRQNSNSDIEKDKLLKKGNRLSVNVGKFFDNKSSHKPNIWEDTFLEPNETVITPKSPTKNPLHNGSPTSLKNRKISNIMNDSNMVE